MIFGGFLTPQSAKAKWRQTPPEKNHTGKYLRPLNNYRQAKSIEDYFWQRVTINDKEQCWQFATTGDKDGYPQVVGSRHCKLLGLTRAHHVAYYIAHGQIPNKMFVCHTCDNPTCVNPKHLFLGTPNDNVQDMISKGRYSHPTEYGRIYKITSQQKQEIISRKGLQSSTVVAAEFRISFSRVCQIWREHDSAIL